MSDSKMAAFLKERPRLLAALFGLTVLLAEVGTVAAANGRAISGT